MERTGRTSKRDEEKKLERSKSADKTTEEKRKSKIGASLRTSKKGDELKEDIATRKSKTKSLRVDASLKAKKEEAKREEARRKEEEKKKLEALKKEEAEKKALEKKAEELKKLEEKKKKEEAKKNELKRDVSKEKKLTDKLERKKSEKKSDSFKRDDSLKKEELRKVLEKSGTDFKIEEIVEENKSLDSYPVTKEKRADSKESVPNSEDNTRKLTTSESFIKREDSTSTTTSERDLSEREESPRVRPKEPKENWNDGLLDSNSYYLIFFDEDFNLILQDNELDPSDHWENVLQQEGGTTKINSLPTPAPLQSLSKMYQEYVKEGGQSITVFVRSLANSLKGTKQTYLNYLIDHYCFQLHSVPKQSKVENTPAPSPAPSPSPREARKINHHRSFSAESDELSKMMKNSSTKVSVDRKIQSVAHRVNKRVPLKTSTFSEFREQRHARMQNTPTTPHNSPQQQHKTGDELEDLLESLIQAERLHDAIACKQLIDKRQLISVKETEYELAKSEDRLHDAIAIRQEIQDLQKYVSDTTATMVPKWKAASSSQPTLHQMQQLLVEKFGTAKALTFMSQFDVELPTLAKSDLASALDLQEKAIESFKQLTDGTSPEEIERQIQLEEEEMKRQREERKKEEQERWLREAAEKKKKKQMMKREIVSTILQGSSEPPVSKRPQTIR